VNEAIILKELGKITLYLRKKEFFIMANAMVEKTEQGRTTVYQKHRTLQN